MFKNKWKWAFFLLVGFLVAFVLVMVFLIFQPVEQTSSKVSENRKEVPFKVTTKKDDLTELINYYLEKEGLTGPVHYEVNLTNEVELYGTLPIFNTNIQMKLTFEPTALDNGDLLLKQKEISIGQLPLPVSYIMSFIENQYKMPGWVDIQPDEEQIYVHLTELKVNNGLKVEVTDFDLVNDHIQFDLLLPTEQ
ncbi:YpmS family protein [Bacillus sp. B1-b2]|uniref:YpmS family protein n=1 Tax=Bacillus sp. B1-b2 TaxID=2653201 RepID=UPI0012620078|nr:YpmS family protein [Bacillus sp. B1-b2]KAB7673027.1 YpmS family protein [Bacillus sp. B1-b2]